MVDELFLEGWVRRMRVAEPGALAVLVTGSYARGDAGPHSDLDLLVLTRGEPRAPYRAHLAERDDGRLLHVSVGAKEWRDWLGRRARAADWARFLPAREAARVLWAADEVRWRLADPTLERPPGSVELEDFVSAVCKAKNAQLRSDELALRLAAQELATLCPSVLRPLNPPAAPRSPYEALHAVLALPVAPPGYREDMLLCLGLSGRATDAEAVYAAALRLALGTLALLRPRAEELAGEVEPELPRFLADGTLERFVEQE